MGYIKEPEGVDFIIQSEPLTDKDREQISKFIKEYKRKNRSKKSKKNGLEEKQRVRYDVSTFLNNVRCFVVSSFFNKNQIVVEMHGYNMLIVVGGLIVTDQKLFVV